MGPEEILLPALAAAFALEFIYLSYMILSDIRVCYVYEICISRPQKGFYICIFIITLVRIFHLVIAAMAYYPEWVRPIACIESVAVSYVFSIILFLWWCLHRWKVYLSNNFHLSSEEKKAKELIVKRLFIYIDIFILFAYFGCCIFILLGYDEIHEGDYFYFSLRLYQIFITLLLVCGVYYIGIKLLRQIKQYAYATPHILILSLYFSLSGLTVGLLCIVFTIALPQEYRGYSTLTAFVISQNFIVFIPFLMFYIFQKRHHTYRVEDDISDLLKT
jgi:hypothetical protein